MNGCDASQRQANSSTTAAKAPAAMAWWLQSTDDRGEALPEKQSQWKSQEQQLHEPDMSVEVLGALSQSEQDRYNQFSDRSKDNYALSHGQIDETDAALQLLQEGRDRARRIVQRSVSNDTGLSNASSAAAKISGTAATNRPMTIRGASSTGSSPAQPQPQPPVQEVPTEASSLKDANWKDWRKSQRRAKVFSVGLPTPAGTAAASSPSHRPIEEGNSEHSTASVSKIPRTTITKQPPSRSVSMGDSNNSKSNKSDITTDTREVEQIIRREKWAQEKKTQQVFTSEWGVGDADVFVKKLQERGKLVSSGTKSKTSSRRKSSDQPTSKQYKEKHSWEQLNLQVQASALQNVQQFKQIPKLKRAAFTLILSQLLTQEQRQQLYQIYFQQINVTDNKSCDDDGSANHHNSHDNTNNEANNQGMSPKLARQSYKKVFGDQHARLNSNNDADETTQLSASAQATASEDHENEHKDGNNLIMDYSEFVVGAAMCTYHHTNPEHDQSQLIRAKLSGEYLGKAFRMFDQEGKGFISREDLKDLCSHQDETTQHILDQLVWSSEEEGEKGSSSRDMMTPAMTADEKNDNNINFADFVSLFFDAKDEEEDGTNNNYSTTSAKDKKDKKSRKSSKHSKKHSKKKSKRKEDKKSSNGPNASVVIEEDDISIDDSFDKDLDTSYATALNASSASIGSIEIDDISIDFHSDNSDDDRSNDLDKSSNMSLGSKSNRSSKSGSRNNSNGSKSTRRKSSSSKKNSKTEQKVFDWKSFSKTKSVLKVKYIMAKAKSQRNMQVPIAEDDTKGDEFIPASSKPQVSTNDQQGANEPIKRTLSLPESTSEPSLLSHSLASVPENEPPSAAITKAGEERSTSTTTTTIKNVSSQIDSEGALHCKDDAPPRPIQRKTTPTENGASLPTSVAIDNSNPSRPVFPPNSPRSAIKQKTRIVNLSSTAVPTLGNSKSWQANGNLRLPGNGSHCVEAGAGACGKLQLPRNESPCDFTSDKPMTTPRSASAPLSGSKKSPASAPKSVEKNAASTANSASNSKMISTGTIAANCAASETASLTQDSTMSSPSSSDFVMTRATQANTQVSGSGLDSASAKPVINASSWIKHTPSRTDSNDSQAKKELILPSNPWRDGQNNLLTNVESKSVKASAGASDALNNFVKTAAKDPFIKPKFLYKFRTPAKDEYVMDPVEKQKREESKAKRRAAFAPKIKKLPKAMLWELKANQSDLARKLKPVPKKHKRKFVDPDRPYRDELQDVQSTVLPVWRQETYAYWI